MNSVIGFLGKRAKAHVMKPLTDAALAYDAPLLERTDEARGVYWIRNVQDLSFNYQPWHREIVANARAMVKALVDRAEAAGHPVIYCHTDGFWVSAEAEPLFEDELGDALGQLKIEKRAENGVLVKSKNKAVAY
jgi:hypothetical protein